MSPMIANGLVRGALPALGQPKTHATIPHSHRRGKEFRHRSVCAAGQPAYSQVRLRIRLSASDRKFPSLTGRLGTQRARRLLSRTTVGSSAPWSSSPPSDLRITSAYRTLLAGPAPVLASGSQGAAGGDRWLLMAVRGHLGGTSRPTARNDADPRPSARAGVPGAYVGLRPFGVGSVAALSCGTRSALTP